MDSGKSSAVERCWVDKFTGPGSDNRPSDRLTYFVDDVGKLWRLVAKVGSGPDPVVIDLLPGDAAKITTIPAGDHLSLADDIL